MPTYSPIRSNKETRETIVSNMQDRFGIESNRVDSMTKILGDIVSQEVVNVNRETRSYLRSLNPTNASGEDLDSLAREMYSLSRNESSRAYSDLGEKNIYFYTVEVNFGSINGGNNIVIPKGSLIATSENFDSNNAIIYETVEEYVLKAEDRFGYCGVRALGNGSKYNVTSRSLVFHNVISYANSNEGNLLVSNLYPILNGSNRETDDSLRFRILNYIASRRDSNLTSLKLSSLNIPGVTNIEVIPSYFGIGSSAIVVFGSEKETNTNLITLTQRRLNSLLGENNRTRVIQGVYVYIDLDLTVYISEKTNLNDRTNIERQVREVILEHVLNSNISRSIDFSKVESGLRSLISQRKIVGFGSLEEGRSIFDHIYIRKTDLNLDSNESRKEYLGNFLSVEKDERLKIGDINIRFEVNKL